MSIENFVANLEARLAELRREYAITTTSGRKGAITREMTYIREKLKLATRERIQ